MRQHRGSVSSTLCMRYVARFAFCTEGRAFARNRPNSVSVGHSLFQSRPGFAQIWPDSGNVGPNSTKLGARSRPNLGRTRPVSAYNVARNRSKLPRNCRVRPNLARNGPKASGIRPGQNFTGFDQLRPDLARLGHWHHRSRIWTTRRGRYRRSRCDGPVCRCSNSARETKRVRVAGCLRKVPRLEPGRCLPRAEGSKLRGACMGGGWGRLGAQLLSYGCAVGARAPAGRWEYLSAKGGPSLRARAPRPGARCSRPP